ncbi:MAG: hypothetical protein FJ207_15055 [Gemmatimonadetes bacterium]|nr:hypothetical protein [Gemmatimonadota bacterium]
MRTYGRAARTVYELHYHVVFTTKYRKPVLRGDTAVEVRDLVRQICQGTISRSSRGRETRLWILSRIPPWILTSIPPQGSGPILRDVFARTCHREKCPPRSAPAKPCSRQTKRPTGGAGWSGRSVGRNSSSSKHSAGGK